MGIVIAVFAALVLVVCGCLCAGSLFLDGGGSDSAAEDPWGRLPDDDSSAPATAAPTPGRPASVAPTPSKKPITRPTSGPAPVTVVYEVSGEGAADIAYYDAESDLMHVDNAKLPWRMTIRTNGKSRVMVEVARPDDTDSRAPLDCVVTVTGAGKPIVDKRQGYGGTVCRVD